MAPVTPVSFRLTRSVPPMLTPSKWQFKFFDVSQVKLPDDESSILSEV